MGSLQHNNFKTVVLADLSYKGILFTDSANDKEKNQKEIYTRAVKRSFEKLKNYNVLVLLDTPYVPFDPSLCKKRPLSFTKPKCEFFNNNETYEMHRDVITQIAKKYSNVRVFDISSLFCRSGKCNLKIGNKVMFRDNNHLNVDGSLYVASFIAEQIEKFSKQ